MKTICKHSMGVCDHLVCPRDEERKKELRRLQAEEFKRLERERKAGA